MLATDSGNDSTPGATFAGHACPVCGAPDRVEKVSSLVRRNSGTVVMGGTPHPYFSSLAAVLNIPPRPRGHSLAHSLTWAAVSGAFALLAVLVLSLLGDQDLVDIPASYLHDARRVVVFAFAVAIPAFLLLRLAFTTFLAYRRTPGWEDLRARWSRLYYCANDDMIFFRGDSRSATPEDMHAFLAETRSAIAAVPAAVRPEPETAATPA